MLPWEGGSSVLVERFSQKAASQLGGSGIDVEAGAPLESRLDREAGDDLDVPVVVEGGVGQQARDALAKWRCP